MQRSAKTPRSTSRPADAMKNLRALMTVLLLCLATTSAVAREVINRFISDVTINVDGSLDVRETITLRAEGNQIKRGILRDFPTRYKNPSGTQVRVGFEVISVQRDGAAEPFGVESIANGKRIKIGDPAVFLDSGEHTYKIAYRTTRQIGFFENFDELYWNVTGNGWTFAIEEAIAIIRLPDGAEIKQSKLYTGRQGSTESEGEVAQETGNRFNARTTRTLNAGEGFTVAVAWQKGIVSAPTAADAQLDWVNDNLGYFSLFATLLGVLTYYFLAWTRVGRDPPKGTIVPLFHPPEGLGAAGTRYVWKQGYDDKVFAAGLVGLAVKGRLKISDDAGDYTIARSNAKTIPLTTSETAMLQAIPQSLHLDQANHAQVGGIRERLSAALDNEYDGTMFLKNIRWFVLGLCLSIAGLLISALLMPDGFTSGVMAVGAFSSVWWMVILFVGWSVVKGLFTGIGFFSKIKSLMAMVFLLPFIGAGVAIPAVAAFTENVSPVTYWLLAALVAIGLMNFLFYWLLKAPTPKGRQILDQIEGFRLYMTTAEEERLKVLHPPEKTPELFERYLPFAMALDCENEWNDKFAATLAAAAAVGVATADGWYNGSSNFGTRDFSDSLGSSLTSSISSSATPPGSSSGSGGGGGGSSGGGGGGGGGSGW